ncbi:MAG: hypothetical protein K5663_00960 [Clostridiales bacterium]|nr:hypothetical protein [Clostridiales bacterium]
MDLSKLWNYMQSDMEADRFSNEMKSSANRRLLLKNAEILKEQQVRFAKVDEEITAMLERLDSQKAETERVSQLFAKTMEEIGDVSKLDENEIEDKMKLVERLSATFDQCQRELTRLAKDADNAVQTQNQIKRLAAKTKAEYDRVKKEYDTEFALGKQKLKKLRDAADQLASGLDPADLERYRQIKQHVTPPIAKLENNQCTGCFMTLSVGTIRGIKASGMGVTCDNCGRLLFLSE